MFDAHICFIITGYTHCASQAIGCCCYYNDYYYYCYCSYALISFLALFLSYTLQSDPYMYAIPHQCTHRTNTHREEKSNGNNNNSSNADRLPNFSDRRINGPAMGFFAQLLRCALAFLYRCFFIGVSFLRLAHGLANNKR